MSPPRPETSSSRHRSCDRRQLRSRARTRRRSGPDQRGSATVELVILLPALFAVMFLGMQAALYYHARTLAIAAAEEGARAAGAEHAQPGAGVTAASAFLSQTGHNSALQHATETAQRDATTATVTVHGFSLSVIPGWKPSVTQSASVTVERLTPP